MSTDPWSPSPEAIRRAEEEKRVDEPVTPSQRASTRPSKPVVPESASTAQRKANLAMDGRIATPAQFPHAPFPGFNLEELEYEVNELSDSADLRNVMHSILISRRRLFQVTKILQQAQRAAVEAKYEWKSAFNRKLLALSGGTEKERVALAEISVEQEYGAYIAAEQAADDALNLLRAIRTELDSLQNMSYNIRAQMQIM